MAVRIAALETALPTNRLSQQDVKELAPKLFPARPDHLERMLPVYDNTGVETRYSCLPPEWFFESSGWPERTDLFLEHAPALAARAIERCLDAAGLAPEDIDSLVAVSSSGVATPFLDAHLLNRLSFRSDVECLPLFSLGCAGGATGLARAASLARTRPGKRVLLVAVELPTLTYRAGDESSVNIVASALFGDGAAAVLLENSPGPGPAVVAAGEHHFRESLQIMGWRMEPNGFGLELSTDLPSFIERELGPAVRSFLARQKIRHEDLRQAVSHPGSLKVLAAIQKALAPAPDGLQHAAGILKDYGNMSSATVLFVLRRTMDHGLRLPLLLSALGPGFTASFVILG